MAAVRRLSRDGWTLSEMIVSLSVGGLVVALAGGAALGQLRFFQGVTEVGAARSQVWQAASITANVLRDVATPADIHMASDSAIEMSLTIGSAITCSADTAGITVPKPATLPGHTLSAFLESPQSGDRVHVLVADSLGELWMNLSAAGPAAATRCARVEWSTDALRLPLAEPFAIAAGAHVRITRRARISLYRAADQRWYIGYREWNPNLNRFNVIQPVAGPLLPYAKDGRRSGLAFEYRDAAGSVVAPVSTDRIALVSVTTRGESRRVVRAPGLLSESAPLYSESATISVALPR